jgi:hypothetical protein
MSAPQPFPDQRVDWLNSARVYGEGSMNHSMNSLDRVTHLKIVVVALLGAILVAGIGIAAHTGVDGVAMASQGYGPVVKAGKPVAYTRADGKTIR